MYPIPILGQHVLAADVLGGKPAPIWAFLHGRGGGDRRVDADHADDHAHAAAGAYYLLPIRCLKCLRCLVCLRC